MKAFNAKTAYVYGGSSGIGLAIAERLAAAGARVVLLARDTARLSAACKRVAAHSRAPGRGCESLSVDVTDAGSVSSAAAEAHSTFGPPDILVNSAGQGMAAHIDDIDEAAFDHMIRLNLFGTRHTVMAHLPVLKRGAHILNVSSVAGFLGVFGFSAYCAAKFGVMGFSEALRAELRPRGMGVSVLCPPDTDTPGFHLENRTKPLETRAVSGRGGLLTADTVAKCALKGIQAGRFVIVPGVDGTLTYWVSRVLPALVFRIMDADARRAVRPHNREVP
ncbi:MAG: SDR family oxidoreductase [Pseudomonadota bacterium]